MADRKKPIEIVRLPHKGEYHIYSDLSVSQLKSIEGLSTVLGAGPCVFVWVDPRYDANEVIQEIRELAVLQNLLADDSAGVE